MKCFTITLASMTLVCALSSLPLLLGPAITVGIFGVDRVRRGKNG